MSIPAILATGGSGQIGTGLRQLGGDRFALVAPSRAELDLTDPAAIARVIASRDWAAVINCAAYTAVDRAETDRDAAFALNADAPRRLAEATGQRGIPLLHVSTDYVFDGHKPSPYGEDDPVAPLSVYGASKEAGERAVRAANARHVILRTAWVVSPWGANFVKTMLRVGSERPEIRVVDDQHGCPTGALDIAATLVGLAERLIADRNAPTGTYHFVNAGEATWFEVARAIFDHVQRAGHGVPALQPIPTSGYPTAARRPANSRLATAKIARDHGIVARDWRPMLDEILVALR